MPSQPLLINVIFNKSGSTRPEQDDVIDGFIADPRVSFRLASQATRRLRESAQQSTRSSFAPDDSSSPDAKDRDRT